jgi:hypothetical protein
MVPPPSQNTVAVCKQITLLILYCIISRLVTLLEVLGAPTHVSDSFHVTVNSRFFNFSLQISLLFAPEMSVSGRVFKTRTFL